MKRRIDPRGLVAGAAIIAVVAFAVLMDSNKNPEPAGGLQMEVPAEEPSITEEEGEAQIPLEEEESAQPPEEGVNSPKGETKKGPYIAVVIDDFGFSRPMAEGYEELDLPLTWAIIPFQSQSRYSMERAEAAGIPYIIHMPMGALADKKWNENKGVIDSGMSDEVVVRLLREAMASLPGALGMNNHRGSRATSDGAVMEAVMTELASTSLFFLDSRTYSKSVAYETARAKGIPAAFSSVFLDNEPTDEFMEKQFERAMNLSSKKGWVVMIGHARPDTLNFLRKKKESLPEGRTFVTMPELMAILWAKKDRPAADLPAKSLESPREASS